VTRGELRQALGQLVEGGELLAHLRGRGYRIDLGVVPTDELVVLADVLGARVESHYYPPTATRKARAIDAVVGKLGEATVAAYGEERALTAEELDKRAPGWAA